MVGEIRFGVLTVSDRCFREEAVDTSGDELVKYIHTESKAGVVVIRKCVPDQTELIEEALCKWSDAAMVDVILTTGGTGFSHRDVTPEATRKVIDKEAPGMIIAIITQTLQKTKMAMLSRAVAGIRKSCVIVNLPGSVKGSKECLDVIVEQLQHAVDLLRDNLDQVSNQHYQMTCSTSFTSHDHCHTKSSVDSGRVSERDRKSRFKAIDVKEAQDIVLKFCVPNEDEKIPSRNGLGRILSTDIVAKDSLPPFPASIKDGYAVKTHENMLGRIVDVFGGSTAGDNPNKLVLTENNCIRISTGAPVPEGADAVIQVENTELVEKTADMKEEKSIRLLVQPVVGQDIRSIGSDIKGGQVVLRRGLRLSPAELGILASVGSSTINVFRKPRIAILSTGNELQNPEDEFLLPGKIRDSNKTTLKAIFGEEGFEVIDAGIARDTPDEVYVKFKCALDAADIVVSTGGVSMGEKDYLREVLQKDLNAEIHFGSVLMKPGKPTKFATCCYKGKQKLIFGLPGNPVSATVTSLLFVIPACRKLSGWETPIPPKMKAQTTEKFILDPSRPEYHRAHVVWGSDASTTYPLVYSTGNQISSRLMSCVNANALVFLPQGTTDMKEIKEGTLVDCILLSHFC